MASSAQFCISKRDDTAPNNSPSAAPAGMAAPIVLTCILVLGKDSEPLLAILRKVTGDSVKPEQLNATVIRRTEHPEEQTDAWLHHHEAAEYLGISKSTLYRYAEHGDIESRKLGNRLEYRRSSLDRFKDQHVRPARRSTRGIISPALSSGN